MRGAVLARRAALLAAVMAAAIAAAFQVSPAGAASSQASWACAPAGFSSLDTFGGAVLSTARGGQIREPDLGQTVNQARTTRSFSPSFPGDGSGLGSRDHARRSHPERLQPVINDQIRVLDTTYAGGEGGFNTGFRFTLAGVDRTVNADWFYAYPGGAEHQMKRALHTGGPETLNMYLRTAGDYLGWAYLPDITLKGNSYLDGVVIDWESL